MYTLFSKGNIAAMKSLLEGEGRVVEVKYGHPFRGFHNAFTLITCNYLVCPFVEPINSRSGYTKEEYEIEKDAMSSRVTVVNFKQKFKDTGFSYDETSLA